MTGSSLQFALVNSTTIENLSRKTIVWTLAIHMPRPSETSSGLRTISFSKAQTPPSPQANLDPDAIRTFAILHTKPGENPFDLGSFRNFKAVMGDRWLDWFLPLRYSPCCDHYRQDSQFAMGPVVRRMRKEAGIYPALTDGSERPQRRRRRRRRRPRDHRERADHSYRNEKVRPPDEIYRRESGHRGEEIDLESGLAFDRDPARHS